MWVQPRWCLCLNLHVSTQVNKSVSTVGSKIMGTISPLEEIPKHPKPLRTVLAIFKFQSLSLHCEFKDGTKFHRVHVFCSSTKSVEICPKHQTLSTAYKPVFPQIPCCSPPTRLHNKGSFHSSLKAFTIFCNTGGTVCDSSLC